MRQFSGNLPLNRKLHDETITTLNSFILIFFIDYALRHQNIRMHNFKKKLTYLRVGGDKNMPKLALNFLCIIFCEKKRILILNVAKIRAKN